MVELTEIHQLCLVYWDLESFSWDIVKLITIKLVEEKHLKVVLPNHTKMIVIAPINPKVFFLKII